MAETYIDAANIAAEKSGKKIDPKVERSIIAMKKLRSYTKEREEKILTNAAAKDKGNVKLGKNANIAKNDEPMLIH